MRNLTISLNSDWKAALRAAGTAAKASSYQGEILNFESAHRAKSTISQVMRYAIATGRAERDPCPDLKGALPSPRVNHFSAIIDPKKVGPLLKAMDDYEGSFVVSPPACLFG